MARTKFSELRKEVQSRPAANERLAAKRAITLAEIQMHELRRAEPQMTPDAQRWLVTRLSPRLAPTSSDDRTRH